MRWSERNRSYTRDLVLHPSADTSNITLQQASGSQRVRWRAACVHMGDAIRKPEPIAAVFWPLKVPLEVFCHMQGWCSYAMLRLAAHLQTT